jgi:hypothetical protein
MRATTSPVLVLVLLAGAGCGGSSSTADGGGGGGSGGSTSGALCSATPTCGGDVVGTWTITDSCVRFAFDLGSTCAGLTAAGTVTYTGSATYNSNLTYTQTATSGATFQYQFPAACVSGNCAQTQAALASSGAGLTNIACRDAGGGGCTCDATIPASSSNETGIYSVSGGILSTTHAGTTDQTTYCVTGATMQQRPSDMAVGGGAAPVSVTGAIALTKQ